MEKKRETCILYRRNGVVTDSGWVTTPKNLCGNCVYFGLLFDFDSAEWEYHCYAVNTLRDLVHNDGILSSEQVLAEECAYFVSNSDYSEKKDIITGLCTPVHHVFQYVRVAPDNVDILEQYLSPWRIDNIVFHENGTYEIRKRKFEKLFDDNSPWLEGKVGDYLVFEQGTYSHGTFPVKVPAEYFEKFYLVADRSPAFVPTTVSLQERVNALQEYHDTHEEEWK